MDLDGRGIPGGFIASAEFEEAANAQAAAFGFEPAVTYVRHPIQDRTDDEMREIADDAFDKVIGMICASN